MQKSHPLVSIIVPMFNAENFVSATLASVLRENEIPIEVIVVNDQSTDRSLDRVREFDDNRLHIINGPGRGASGAMNAGLAHASGSIVMICDSDDLYPDGRISRQVEWLCSHPEYDAVCGDYSTIDDRGNLIAELRCGDKQAEITDELLGGKLRTSFCTYALRSSLAKKTGEFREFFQSSYDIDFQLRLCELGRIAYIPENWYLYRIHASSIIHTQPNLLREFFERTAFELQRQRQTSGLDDLQRGYQLAKPDFGGSEALSAGDHIQGQLLGRAWREHRAGNKLSAMRIGIRAMATNPANVQVWKSIVALALKSSGKGSS